MACHNRICYEIVIKMLKKNINICHLMLDNFGIIDEQMNFTGESKHMYGQ